MQTQYNLDDVQTAIPIDTLVHLGAGRCSELDEYLALQPRQLFLIEADPQLAEALQSRTENLKQVQVCCAAVAGQPGSATFYRYNLPDVSSLHAASGLLEIFPGLKMVEQLQVEAVSLITLLQPMQLQAEQENLLVIDLPGEELQVLQALLQAELLHLFRQVRLQCGREPLYAGSDPAARVLEWLRGEGFELVAEDNSRDPDRPCWSLRCNILQVRNRDLQLQVEVLHEQLEQSAAKKEKLAQHAAELQAQVKHIMQELDSQAKLSGEHHTLIEQLTKARDEQSRLAFKLQMKIAELNKAHEEQAKFTADLQEKIKQLINTENKQRSLIERQKAEIGGLKASLQDEKNRAAQLEFSIRHPLLFGSDCLTASFGQGKTIPSGQMVYADVRPHADKYEALAHIHLALNPGFYLEIGVQQGKSLSLAQCKAIGIDPVPQLRVLLGDKTNVITTTSDEFFIGMADKHVPRPPDLVLIDGMPLLEYVLRDFNHIERLANTTTLVVIANIYPEYPEQANRRRQGTDWIGDTWKLPALLATHRPDLFTLGLDVADYGLLLVAGLNPDNKALEEQMAAISKEQDTTKHPPAAVMSKQGAVPGNHPAVAALLATLRRAREQSLSAAQLAKHMQPITTQ